MIDPLGPNVFTPPAEMMEDPIPQPNLADITARLERIEKTMEWLLAAIVDKSEN